MWHARSDSKLSLSSDNICKMSDSTPKHAVSATWEACLFQSYIPKAKQIFIHRWRSLKKSSKVLSGPWMWRLDHEKLENILLLCEKKSSYYASVPMIGCWAQNIGFFLYCFFLQKPSPLFSGKLLWIQHCCYYSMSIFLTKKVPSLGKQECVVITPSASTRWSKE